MNFAASPRFIADAVLCDPDWLIIMETPERLAKLREMFKVVDLPDNVLPGYQGLSSGAFTAPAFEAIAKADPTARVNPGTGEIMKAGIYTQWMCSLYSRAPAGARQRFIGEDLQRLTDDLELYDRVKGQLEDVRARNIFNIKDAATLAKVVEPFRGQEEEVGGGESNNTTVLLKNSHILVIIPHSQEASCKYGAGTRWCTAASRNNYFDQYNQRGSLFIVILHTPSGDEKYQFHFSDRQYMDSDDSPIDAHDFFLNHPEAGKAIYAYMEKNEGGVDAEVAALLDFHAFSGKMLAREDFNGVPALVLAQALESKTLPTDDPRLQKIRHSSVLFTPDHVEYLLTINEMSENLILHNNRDFFADVMEGTMNEHGYDYGSHRMKGEDLMVWINATVQRAIMAEAEKAGAVEDGEIAWRSEWGDGLHGLLANAMDDAQSEGEQSEYQKRFMSEIEDLLLAHKWTTPDGEVYHFQVRYPNFYKAAKRLATEQHEGATYPDCAAFSVAFAEFLSGEGQLGIPKNVSGTIDSEYMSSTIHDRLNELDGLSGTTSEEAEDDYVPDPDDED